MEQKYLRICEELGWNIEEYDDEIEFSTESPAGEDFRFNVSKNNFINDIKEYATNFDVDEHIAMWIEAKQNGVSGVPSIRELVKDAEDIDNMLEELAIALCKVKG